ncbi:MAG: BadF/BadG/BcrA/BcrD ATPase family protein, partial [Vulcanimicrobiaceae bacterium]
MSPVVGVDAGGSRVTAVAPALDGVHRFGHAESANIRTVGLDRAVESIVLAIERALLGAPPAAVAVGAAGAGSEGASSVLRLALEGRFPGARIAVYEDTVIALRAGVPSGDGLALIAGTGSIAYGEVGVQRYRVGGYGYLVGDDGSGFSIGSAAVRLLLRAYDGRA